MVWNRAALAALLALAAGCAEPPQTAEPGAIEAADYVGSGDCRACHEGAYADWSDSHHALAMQPATEQSVRGDFDDATFEYGGVTSRFFRGDDGGFRVETDGADGARAVFEIAYAFGVEPLQQYLIETQGGRLQALSIVWDGRPGEERWYHLYPDDDVDHEDVLHWTAASQNWNAMCADCHSTNVTKGYDPETATFDTRFAEISVGCEACHGPGSLHVEAPGAPYGAAAAAIETCAPCHSRRAQIAEGYRPGAPLLDHYVPASVAPPLYHADGQILDEVYVYGSFLQSRMYARGVVCGDCHEPHGAGLLAEGDALCERCHTPNPPAAFATLNPAGYGRDHDHHPDDVLCVDCHMPSRTYMGIDARRDHGLRVPRPDLTVAYGVPNPCRDCHADRTAQWAADSVRAWTGAAPTPGLADALILGARFHFDAERALTDTARDPQASGFVRGVALAGLGAFEFGYSQDAIAAGLRDPDPWVRLSALQGSARLPETPRWGAIKRLLQDPIRAVRIDAARFAAPYLAQPLDEDDRALIEAALEENTDAQRLNAERPEAHTNIGIVRLETGDAVGAEAAFRQALEIQPRWTPALVNLADLYRATGRDGDGRALLEQAAEIAPESADVRYALGLWYVRAGLRERAVEALKAAYDLEPNYLRNAFTYGLAIQSQGDAAGAVEVFESAHAAFGPHRSLLQALMSAQAEAGRLEDASVSAERLVALYGRAFEPALAQIRARLAAEAPSVVEE